MNKLHRKITQSRIRAIRSGLKKLKGKYPSYLKSHYTPEQNKFLAKKFVDGSTHSACLELLNRSDKWLLKAYDMMRSLGYLATCRGTVDFWLHDQRLIAHYLVHGKLELSENGKAFYEDSDNLRYIIPYMEMVQRKCHAYDSRNSAIQQVYNAHSRRQGLSRTTYPDLQPTP